MLGLWLQDFTKIWFYFVLPVALQNKIPNVDDKARLPALEFYCDVLQESTTCYHHHTLNCSVIEMMVGCKGSCEGFRGFHDKGMDQFI